MKVLIIGNRKHQLIRSLVSEIKRYFEKTNKNLIIDILSQEVEEIKERDNLFSAIYTLELPSFISINRFLRGIFKQILFRIKLNQLLKKYDIVHVHYVEDIILRDVDFFLNKSIKKLIISIWGSDYLRANNNNKEKLLKLLNRADIITVSNSTIEQEIKLYYKERLQKINFNICYFMIEPLYTLQEIQREFTREQSCDLFKLHKGKKIITIGYNASRIQQHLKILDVLEQNKTLIKKSKEIEIILPLTYPKDKKYIGTLRQRANKSCYKIILLTNFMKDIEIAHLRNASDIMIQLQTTDMLSASMIEHLCAGNIVITGDWLPYEELKNIGVSFSSISKIEDLPLSLQIALENKNNFKCADNKQMISKFFDKNILLKRWIELYR